MKKNILIFLLFTIIAACTSSNGNPLSEPTQRNIPATSVAATSTLVATQTSPNTTTPPDSAAAQPLPSPVTYGPDKFPEGYNPLTGQPVSDPARLEYPALLLSVTHFPPQSRPQYGFFFTPFVYEFYITEGATRHLAVVYGEFPAPEIPLYGECEVRSEPIAQADIILGNRVWHDVNENGVQEPREEGIGGICVNLLDENGTRLQQTTTDSNGYFGFPVEAGTYNLEFELPSWLAFTGPNLGEERTDSDVDQASGRIEGIDVSTSSPLFWDAGLVVSSDITPTPNPEQELPQAEFGPIRSGRVFYRYLAGMYEDSCLIYAGADPAVRAQIPGCAMVTHTVENGGARLDLERMAKISEQIKKDNPDFNYASNLFSDNPPAGGQPATELREFWAFLNQSKWTYDAASGSWWRYIDESNPATAGQLHPLIDRLNGRQVQYENVILAFAEHTVIRPTIIDINLAPGNQGKAYHFRDGRMYEIKWSTVATEYQQETGRGQPIRFINSDGTPTALKPGKTWVILFNLESYLENVESGIFRARFVPPLGAKIE
ncbi:MAG TPA: SdrD B-like domain-containing protein [Anaerolineales bacterium]|nr:SdrD B-like domain-containing protein [Anaerolineales bacterium]